MRAVWICHGFNEAIFFRIAFVVRKLGILGLPTCAVVVALLGALSALAALIDSMRGVSISVGGRTSARHLGGSRRRSGHQGGPSVPISSPISTYRRGP